MFIGNTEFYIERRQPQATAIPTADGAYGFSVGQLGGGRGRRYKRLPGRALRHRLIFLGPRYQLHIVRRASRPPDPSSPF